MKLTIGMATYDDYDGCVFTLQSLRMFHDLSNVELIVVDNKPDSANSLALRSLIENGMQLGTAGARYVAAGEIVGTSAPRNRVFEEATGDAVMCIDSHVLLPPGVVARLIDWYEKHPESLDLLQGPLLEDDLKSLAGTHFSDMWRGEMWGVWGQAWQACDGGEIFTVVEGPSGQAEYRALEMNGVPLTSSARCGVSYPVVPHAGHQSALIAAGCRPLGFHPDDEFDIPGQGLGLFTCRKEAWLGFNPNFRGFGGEEMYVHEKFRRAGRRCLCLGFLKWWHRFGAPNGIKYPLTHWNKIRNYVLGHLELGLPLDRVHEHFVKSGIMQQLEWDALVKDPVPPMPPQEVLAALATPAAPPELSIDAMYEVCRTIPRDLNEHVPKLRQLAEQCPRVTEFSHRRESVIAFAAAGVSMLAYNTEAADPFVRRLAMIDPRVRIENKASPDVGTIDETDLLFIDSQHTEARLTSELKKYAPSVTRYIVMHDTDIHATKGEDGGPGLVDAIKKFLDANPDWFIAWHTRQQFGLTVLGRRPEDRPQDRIILWSLGYGPGTELKAMLTDIGIVASITCSCNAVAFQMDAWGVDGCGRHREDILKLMRQNYEGWGWKQKLGLVAAAGRAVASGLAFSVNPLDPLGSLVEEAIRRAEEKQNQKEAA